jgi:hypothetical protein
MFVKIIPWQHDLPRFNGCNLSPKGHPFEMGQR